MNKRFALKLFFISLSVFVQVQLSAQADDNGFRGFTTPKSAHDRSVLKSNIIPLFIGQIPFTGELRLTYERALAKHHSITVGASYDFPNFILLAIGGNRGFGGGGGGRRPGGRGRNTNSLRNVSVEGGRVTLGYRYYPFKKWDAPKGFFFGPYLSYNAANIREKNSSTDHETVNYFNASAITGYQFIFKRHFTLEFFGGLGYKNNFVLHYDAAADRIYESYSLQISALKNLKFEGQMNFGYQF